jgi:hypothetical protein
MLQDMKTIILLFIVKCTPSHQHGVLNLERVCDQLNHLMVREMKCSQDKISWLQ